MRKVNQIAARRIAAYNTGLLVVLALSVLFFRSLGEPVRPNVKRHVLDSGAPALRRCD